MTGGTVNRCGCLAGLASLLAVLACAEEGGGGPTTTTETHWLDSCMTSGDCAEQYACQCGLCMLACDSVAFCESQIPAAEVLPPNDPSTLQCSSLGQGHLPFVCVLEESDQADVCLPVCESRADCLGYGGDGGELYCVEGVCINNRRVGTGPPPPVVGGEEGDENNALDQAVEIELAEVSAEWLWLSEVASPFLPIESSVRGRLDPEENPASDTTDRDYYGCHLDEGSWVAIATAANPSRLGLIDTVVALYDPTGQRLGFSNDALGCRASWGLYLDSELVVWLPPGDYVVEVADETDWNGQHHNDPGDYRLGVGRIQPDTPSLLMASEVGDDEASAAPIPAQVEAQVLLGRLGEADDVDVFRLPTTPRAVVVFRRMPPGIDGHGGPPVQMWLTEAGSTTPIARVDGKRDELAVPVGPGAYLLWVARDPEATSSTGVLDHYVIKHERTAEDCVLEADDSANDTLAGNQPLDGAACFVTWLDDGDVDYWSLDAFNRVECRSRLDGSGVQGLSLELRDGDDNLLDTPTFREEEPNSPAVLLDAHNRSHNYLRLTKESQSEVSGQFVRCRVQ